MVVVVVVMGRRRRRRRRRRQARALETALQGAVAEHEAERAGLLAQRGEMQRRVLSQLEELGRQQVTVAGLTSTLGDVRAELEDARRDRAALMAALLERRLPAAAAGESGARACQCQAQ